MHGARSAGCPDSLRARLHVPQMQPTPVALPCVPQGDLAQAAPVHLNPQEFPSTILTAVVCPWLAFSGATVFHAQTGFCHWRSVGRACISPPGLCATSLHISGHMYHKLLGLQADLYVSLVCCGECPFFLGRFDLHRYRQCLCGLRACCCRSIPKMRPIEAFGSIPCGCL